MIQTDDITLTMRFLIFENLVVIFHIIVLVFLIIDKDIFKKIAYNGGKGEAYDNKSNLNRYGWNVFNR